MAAPPSASGQAQSAPHAACRDKAYELLAGRPHFRRELERKLAARGFDGAATAAVCDGLEERGLLDDLACARGLARGRFRRKLFGPLRVRAELQRRGAAAAVIDEVVEECFADGDGELAAEAARRWLDRHRADRARLGRHLAARGFSRGAIHRQLERLGEPADG